MLPRLQTCIFNYFVDTVTWILSRRPGINSLHVLLLSWAPAPGKEPNAYCHTPGRPPTRLPFHQRWPTTNSSNPSHFSITQCHHHLSADEPYLWPLSTSTCSLPTGPPCHVHAPRFLSSRHTSVFPQHPKSLTLYPVSVYFWNLSLTLTSLWAEMSPPPPYDPRSWNVTLSK